MSQSIWFHHQFHQIHLVVLDCICLYYRSHLTFSHSHTHTLTHTHTHVLLQYVLNGEPGQYTYYGICAPWACVKILRLLQLFPFPGITLLISNPTTFTSTTHSYTSPACPLSDHTLLHITVFQKTQPALDALLRHCLALWRACERHNQTW